MGKYSGEDYLPPYIRRAWVIKAQAAPGDYSLLVALDVARYWKMRKRCEWVDYHTTRAARELGTGRRSIVRALEGLVSVDILAMDRQHGRFPRLQLQSDPFLVSVEEQEPEEEPDRFDPDSKSRPKESLEEHIERQLAAN